MIDKKPSRLSGSFDDDDLAAQHDDETEAELGGDDFAETGEADAEAMLARQKRKGLILTYGMGAAFAAVVGIMGYPSFKHYFVSNKPVVTAYVGTAVPPNVRKNYFADSQAAAVGANGSAVGESSDALGSVESAASPPGAAMGQALNAQASPPAEATLLPPPATPPKDGTGVAPAANTTVSGSGSQVAEISPSQSAAQALPPATVPPPSSPPTGQETIPAIDEVPAASAGDVKDLKGQIDKLQTANAAQATQVLQLQATVENLQKQIADLSTVKPDVPSHTAVPSSSKSSVQNAPVKWQLRSAVDGAALLGRPNSSELKHVVVGDLVKGLGKITSIREQDGRWVVEGTDGSVSQ
jgi:hypothetical protein